MAIEITIPRLGWNMEEGIFVGWLKADGQTVKAGEPLFSLEGDKATQEIESLEAGILRIPPDGPKEGEKVAVGAVVGYLVAPAKLAPFDSAPQPGRELDAAARAMHHWRSETQIRPRPMTTHDSRNANSRSRPVPRRVARELGIDPAAVKGSGKTGRIVERDIRAAAGVGSGAHRRASCRRSSTRPTATQLRRPSIKRSPSARFARRSPSECSRATRQRPRVTITTTVDATNLVNLRRQFKAVLEAGEAPPIGYTEIIVKLTAIALAKHPMLNSRWNGNQIQVWRSIHIGIAVDTEAGLMVPVIRDVPRLSLRELAACARDSPAAPAAENSPPPSFREARSRSPTWDSWESKHSLL